LTQAIVQNETINAMKPLLVLLSLAFLISTSRGENEDESITFTPTHPDGFGVVFKREITVRKIVPDPRAKLQDVWYHLVIPNTGKNPVEVRGSSKWVHEELADSFGEDLEVKLLVFAYEGFIGSGLNGAPRASNLSPQTTFPMRDTVGMRATFCGWS
jgi:hypothetical protein